MFVFADSGERERHSADKEVSYWRIIRRVGSSYYFLYDGNHVENGVRSRAPRWVDD